MEKSILTFIVAAILTCPATVWAGNYPIVDSGQEACFDNSRQIQCPAKGDSFYGQDAQYKGNQPRYKDNGDGTISDIVTGLMWVKARGDKQSWQAAIDGAEACRVGGYSDWRAPTIKELYSLIDFNGRVMGAGSVLTPFIDTDYFDFKLGDSSKGERLIDCQDWSATTYVGQTMGGNPTAFGVNFADGRIKGYGKTGRGSHSIKYIRYVRGNPDYGKNAFVNLKNGTVEDKATGLIWQQQDSAKQLNWQEALNYCENLNSAGRIDWRLPNVKELQSIVDYTRSPKTSGSAAINPIFKVTDKESYYWSSTTHMDGPMGTDHAAYIAFGRGMGYFAPPRSTTKKWIDVHGAGAQRSDPKAGNPDNFPNGRGPQGDDIRIYNYARCVAAGTAKQYDPPYIQIKSLNMSKPGSGMGGMGGNRQGFQIKQGMNYDMNQGKMGQSQGMGQGRNRQGPPPEAFTACIGKSQGDDCTVQTPRGKLSGTCISRNGQPFCAPSGHRQGGMGRRPMQ
ncbi:DUF1566 domain-containing protein [Maridesulfovibrio sp.]|uniref:Lcl C-terminal domain-containing protein n=1 Tax=Maridesulfovibrio sp. TaxID=2795000 RepID=UPI0039F143D4